MSRLDPLSLNNITDDFIAKSLTNPLTFAVKPGEILGISGDNGSGKSTLIEIIGGIKKPKQGTILWREEELKKMRDRKHLLTLITQESAQQFFTSDVRAELDLIQNNANQDLAQQLINLFQIDKLFGRQIEALSYGEKQRLAIVYGMLSNTKILLFDEPTYGMDNLTYGCFTEACRSLTTLGKILIITSHETQLLTGLADTMVNL